LGYVEDQSLAIEYRRRGKPARMRGLAEELVRLEVDIIMAQSSIYTSAVKRATSTIPIIFLSRVDPLGRGPPDAGAGARTENRPRPHTFPSAA
jgi:putative ABC transport system substrate-binding protein